MQVKRYEAANIQEALVKIKNDMGSDAIVLSTKSVPGKKNYIEVTAARENEREVTSFPDRGRERQENVLRSDDKEIISYFRSEIEELKSLIRGVRKETLHAEIAELKDNMIAFFDVIGLRGMTENSCLSRIYYYLVSRGISKARVYKLLDEMKRNYPLQEINDHEKGLKIAERILSGSLKMATDSAGKRVKVFVGPTGVGKTTTLAKLAARYALEQKVSVGLITTDTYRIAALEQLKVYTRIMDLPLAVANDKEHFRQSLECFSDRDVILVDTPGQSGADEGFISRLKDTISGEQNLEVNLLLSLTASRENLMNAVARFGQFGCNQIIFTKLDECAACGVLYDVIKQAGKPVSYVTMGQNVPKDIEKVNPSRLAELIMWH